MRGHGYLPFTVSAELNIGIRNSAFAGTALSVAYGLEIPKGDETYLHEIREMLETATAFTVPGKYLVEALPALQYMPQWFPGAAFKREAAVASMRIRAILRQLLHAGIENLVSDIGPVALRSECSSTCLDTRHPKGLYLGQYAAELPAGERRGGRGRARDVRRDCGDGLQRCVPHLLTEANTNSQTAAAGADTVRQCRRTTEL